MTNSYNVGDRVEVILHRVVNKNGTDITFEDHYAGTILTYRLLKDRDTGEPFYLYKVSVDGLGDIVFAKETEPQTLMIVEKWDNNIE